MFMFKKDLINIFINELSNRESDKLVNNQFQNDQQKNNLFHYLKFMKENEATTLFLGEASGYNGCRHTGIAFTSGNILYRNVLFEDLRDKLNIKGIEKYNEKSSNIVYEFLNRHPKIFFESVIFNIFPFHPFKENKTESNRKPTKEESLEGQEYLMKLLEIFKFKKIIAIGNVAYDSLVSFSKNHDLSEIQIEKVRHPSYGGRDDFIYQLRQIFGFPLRDYKDITSF